MSQGEKVTFVRYGFLVDDLLADLDNPSRYDIEKSTQNYADLCQQALEQQYPDAEIQVVFEANVSGVLSSLMETQVDGWSDSDEVSVIESLCNVVYQEYQWLVSRPWLTLAEAHRLFHIPIPTIRWACEEGLVREAEKDVGRWGFPRETFAEIVSNIVSIDWEKTLDFTVTGDGICIAQCFLDNTKHVRVVDLPEFQVLVIAPNGFGIPLLSENNSYALVSRNADEMHLRFEHFLDETPWESVPWSYGAYAKALASQARQYEHLDIDWEESEHDGRAYVESIQFGFVYDGTQTCMLREVIELSIETLRSVIQETEIVLSGGPAWKPEYEQDEYLFCIEVLSPLLRKMGFQAVRDRHGRKEYGKDFTFSEPTGFGGLRHYGLQAKAGNVSGGASSDIDKILGQVDDAFAMPYREPGSPEERYISTLIIAISGHFTENAQEKMLYKIPRSLVGSVHFWDQEQIRTLIFDHWGHK